MWNCNGVSAVSGYKTTRPNNVHVTKQIYRHETCGRNTLKYFSYIFLYPTFSRIVTVENCGTFVSFGLHSGWKAKRNLTTFFILFYFIFVIARTAFNYHCPERPMKLKYWNTTVNIVSNINNIQRKYKVLIIRSCHKSSSRKKQSPFSINNWRNLPYENFMGIWQRVRQTQYPTY